MNKACNIERDSERERDTSLRVVKSSSYSSACFHYIAILWYSWHSSFLVFKETIGKLSVIPSRSWKKQCSIDCRFLTLNPHFNIIQKLHVLFHLMLDVSFRFKNQSFIDSVYVTCEFWKLNGTEVTFWWAVNQFLLKILVLIVKYRSKSTWKLLNEEEQA